jgi:drug/metabolite transporter (DMT)-like permease
MKTLIVAVVASLSAAVGDVLVSQGMKRFGERDWSRPSEWLNLVLEIQRNPTVLLGVVFMAGFFFLFLAALSWADVSYLTPLTALTFVFTTVLAKLALGEEMSWRRWLGTLIVMVGVVLISLDAPATKGLYGHADPAPHHRDVPLR